MFLLLLNITRVFVLVKCYTVAIVSLEAAFPEDKFQRKEFKANPDSSFIKMHKVTKQIIISMISWMYFL